MKTFLKNFYHSFPVQLLLLHCRKYQILLVFWYLLFLTVDGRFARSFGAASLFLAPEYLGRVSFYSMIFLGATLGTFGMSWNITTFILHSKRFGFLATTTQPFFKYCLNNFIIPTAFLIFFLLRLYHFQRYEELSGLPGTLLLIEGFLLGLLSVTFISFFYFFNADRSILKSFQRRMGGPRKLLMQIMTREAQKNEDALPVGYYLKNPYSVSRARNISHYRHEFLEGVFRRHHFAAFLTIGLSFLLLMTLSYFISSPVFRIPAGASVLLFFTSLIGLSGAFAYMFRGWAIPMAILFYLLISLLVHLGVLDPRSKAIGLDYTRMNRRPLYSLENLNRLFTADRAARDADQTRQILRRWKMRNTTEQEKPRMIILNVSGGGSRSAAWTMDVLQRADSLLNNSLMKQTVLISGASGGMLAAAYYRELYWEREQGQKTNPDDPNYGSNISKDLLNPVFSYYLVNDFLTPFQFFRQGNNRYAMDRGYAFDQQLDQNTSQVLDKPIGDYTRPEQMALIPLMMFSSTVTEDGRRMLVSSQPVSYLTAPQYQPPDSRNRDIDAIDFCEFFKGLHPSRLALTDALRMGATFPYILPNVYLPSNPIVDVMDAGLRDTYGQELSLRFLHVFRNWINRNTSGVVFIQIRDSRKNEIHQIQPLNSLGGILFQPLFTVQKDWSSIQDYDQDDQFSYAQNFLEVPLERIIFQYVPRQQNKGAALNWHLTTLEKSDIQAALDNQVNQNAFRYLKQAMQY